MHTVLLGTSFFPLCACVYELCFLKAICTSTLLSFGCPPQLFPPCTVVQTLAKRFHLPIPTFTPLSQTSRTFCDHLSFLFFSNLHYLAPLKSGERGLFFPSLSSGVTFSFFFLRLFRANPLARGADRLSAHFFIPFPAVRDGERMCRNVACQLAYECLDGNFFGRIMEENVLEGSVYSNTTFR